MTGRQGSGGHDGQGSGGQGHDGQGHGGPGYEAHEPLSVSELRTRVLGEGPRIGTGWPVLDDVSGGFPVARTTLVRGPSELRLQLLARSAAWAAGEGWSTVLASRTRTVEELWLALGAGGLGLPQSALLETDTHDAWIDARLRVLDVRVLGGPDAGEQVLEAVEARTPALLVMDDFVHWDLERDLPLTSGHERFDPTTWPRRTGCTLVVGMYGMEDFTEWVHRGVLTVRLAPDPEANRVSIGAYAGLRKQSRTVLLRDGFLESPAPGARHLRRPGVANVWEDRSEKDISRFASALGGEVVHQVWEREDTDP